MFITASGMICPVGLTAAAACAAKRAGVAGLAELPYRDNAGEPIIGGAVPGVDVELRGEARLIHLLAVALSDLIESVPQQMAWRNVPLLVALAEPKRLNRRGDLAATFIEKLQTTMGIEFHPSDSRIVDAGHTAGFTAAATARELLSNGRAAACIVCGVDSYLDAASLLDLDREFRLKTPANRDGIIPGEAAAAVMLQLRDARPGGAELIGLGFGREPAHLLSGEPLLGLGLTEAARMALAEAKLGLHEMDVRISDVTGELYGFKELPLVDARLMRIARKAEQPLWHWCDSIGDSGAAASIAQLVLIDQAFRKTYAPGKRAICFGSAIGGKRASAVMQDGRH